MKQDIFLPSSGICDDGQLVDRKGSREGWRRKPPKMSNRMLDLELAADAIPCSIQNNL